LFLYDNSGLFVGSRRLYQK
jgi:hypothetical protein